MGLIEHTQLYRVMTNGDYPVPTNVERKLVIPVEAAEMRRLGYVPADDHQGAVAALHEAREQMTDPSTGSARPNCLAPRMSVDRALATLGGQ